MGCRARSLLPNRGREPTFERGIYGSIIDVTFAAYGEAGRVEDWRVKEAKTVTTGRMASERVCTLQDSLYRHLNGKSLTPEEFVEEVTKVCEETLMARRRNRKTLQRKIRTKGLDCILQRNALRKLGVGRLNAGNAIFDKLAPVNILLTEHELKAASTRLRSQKSPIASHQRWFNLQCRFNQGRRGSFPPIWKKAKLVLLKKEGKRDGLPSLYRSYHP
ncbi:hypothetical protein J6590_025210 [Homalodisca vitripennis]|nr:hypothetical protein J6590_025210 [Homalodisca vitripennis]